MVDLLEAVGKLALEIKIVSALLSSWDEHDI